MVILFHNGRPHTRGGRTTNLAWHATYAAGGEQEVYTYSSDMGETGGAAPSGKRRKPRPRRRPKPDVIAQRLHATESVAEAASDSEEQVAAPDEAADSGEQAPAPEAATDEGSPTVSDAEAALDSEEPSGESGEDREEPSGESGEDAGAVSPDTGGEDDRPGS